MVAESAVLRTDLKDEAEVIDSSLVGAREVDLDSKLLPTAHHQLGAEALRDVILVRVVFLHVLGHPQVHALHLQHILVPWVWL